MTRKIILVTAMLVLAGCANGATEPAPLAEACLAFARGETTGWSIANARKAQMGVELGICGPSSCDGRTECVEQTLVEACDAVVAGSRDPNDLAFAREGRYRGLCNDHGPPLVDALSGKPGSCTRTSAVTWRCRP